MAGGRIYAHPESRLKNSELTPTEPGHSLKSKGGSRHTVMEPDTSPKVAEMEHFAQQLADVLTAGTRQKRFDSVVLVASLISWDSCGIACRPKPRSGSSSRSTKITRLPTRVNASAIRRCSVRRIEAIIARRRLKSVLCQRDNTISEPSS